MSPISLLLPYVLLTAPAAPSIATPPMVSVPETATVEYWLVVGHPADTSERTVRTERSERRSGALMSPELAPIASALDSIEAGTKLELLEKLSMRADLGETAKNNSDNVSISHSLMNDRQGLSLRTHVDLVGPNGLETRVQIALNRPVLIGASKLVGPLTGRFQGSDRSGATLYYVVFAY